MRRGGKAASDGAWSPRKDFQKQAGAGPETMPGPPIIPDTAKEIAKLENEPGADRSGRRLSRYRDACRWPHGSSATFQCCGIRTMGKVPLLSASSLQAWIKLHTTSKLAKPRARENWTITLDGDVCGKP